VIRQVMSPPPEECCATSDSGAIGPISSSNFSSLRNGSFAEVCCSWEKPSFV